MLLDRWQQQIAPLGARVRVTRQQTLGTGEPAVRPPGLAAHQQTKAEPEPAADGAKTLTGVCMSIVSTFKGLDVFIVAANEVCCQRQQLQVLGLQCALLVGARKRQKGVGPGAFPICTAGSVEVCNICCVRIAAHVRPCPGLWPVSFSKLATRRLLQQNTIWRSEHHKHVVAAGASFPPPRRHDPISNA